MVGLFSAGYSICFQARRSLNLSLEAAANVGAVAFMISIALTGNRLDPLGLVVGTLFAVVACAVVGLLIDFACFSAWSRFSSLLSTALSFGFCILLNNTVYWFAKLVFGGLSHLDFPKREASKFYALVFSSGAICFSAIALLVVTKWLSSTRNTPLRIVPSVSFVTATVLAANAVLLSRWLGFSWSVEFPSEFTEFGFTGLCAAIATGLKHPLLAFMAGAIVEALLRLPPLAFQESAFAWFAVLAAVCLIVISKYGFGASKETSPSLIADTGIEVR